MFASLVSMVTAQALYGVSQGAFLITVTEKKHQVTRARNIFLKNYVYNGLCNDLKWLAGIDYLQKQKSEKLQFGKSGLFGQYPATVFCLL